MPKIETIVPILTSQGRWLPCGKGNDGKGKACGSLLECQKKGARLDREYVWLGAKEARAVK